MLTVSKKKFHAFIITGLQTTKSSGRVLVPQCWAIQINTIQYDLNNWTLTAVEHWLNFRTKILALKNMFLISRSISTLSDILCRRMCPKYLNSTTNCNSFPFSLTITITSTMLRQPTRSDTHRVNQIQCQLFRLLQTQRSRMPINTAK